VSCLCFALLVGLWPQDLGGEWNGTGRLLPGEGAVGPTDRQLCGRACLSSSVQRNMIPEAATLGKRDMYPTSMFF
jgi:hypothetical protein